MLCMMTDRIDENLKNSLQVDLDKMAPGLHVQVMSASYSSHYSCVSVCMSVCAYVYMCLFVSVSGCMCVCVCLSI